MRWTVGPRGGGEAGRSHRSRKNLFHSVCNSISSYRHQRRKTMAVTSTKHRIRSAAALQSDFTPIAAINTTPLIDMMLVILIMLIVSIPMSTHKVPLDLPQPSPIFPPTPPPVHRLSVQASGALLWDGQALPPSALPGRLAAFQADPLLPVLELNATGVWPA